MRNHPPRNVSMYKKHKTEKFSVEYFQLKIFYVRLRFMAM